MHVFRARAVLTVDIPAAFRVMVQYHELIEVEDRLIPGCVWMFTNCIDCYSQVCQQLHLEL